MVKIRFLSETDETNGFYILATEARVRGLRGGVYEVTQAHLALLDKHSIHYEVLAPSESLSDEAEALRNSPTVEL
jgi:hypothetical protein